MGETRAGKYGRNLAVWINYTLDRLSEDEMESYKSRFLEELRKYSLEPRRSGEPRNSGCIHELSELAEVNIENPEEFARLVKEGIHLMYQKQTSARVLKSLLEYL